MGEELLPLQRLTLGMVDLVHQRQTRVDPIPILSCTDP